MAETAIAEKLTDAADRVAAAKRARAEAILSGGKVSHKAVLDAEGELDALQQAASIELDQLLCSNLAHDHLASSTVTPCHSLEGGFWTNSAQR